MNKPSWSHGPPKTILLATDLSGRCDRAMDRAAYLAKSWGARLVVLNVLEPEYDLAGPAGTADLPSWRRPPEREAVVAAQMRRDLPGDLQGAEIRVVEGAAVATIEAVAREIDAELIVTGIARDETFGRYLLGSTVERLARQTPVPLLIVKNRLRLYGEVLVATDFSSPSQHALTAAAQFFPGTPLTLLHAWEFPFAGLMDRPALRREWTAMEKEGCDTFVAQSRLSQDQRQDLQVLTQIAAQLGGDNRLLFERSAPARQIGSPRTLGQVIFRFQDIEHHEPGAPRFRQVRRPVHCPITPTAEVCRQKDDLRRSVGPGLLVHHHAPR